MNKLRDILTAPMARNPFLFVRKVRQKALGQKPFAFSECPVSALDYEPLQPLISHLRSWVSGLDVRPRKLEWNEVFEQQFDLDFLLERCREGAVPNDPTLKGDIKLPWEFSRGYSFIVNALSCDTDEKKDLYAEEIAGQMQLWWEHNNDPDGVNWMVAMEVGIRAFNWVCADAVLDGRIASLVGSEKFTYWLWNHGSMIWDRLEYSLAKVSNHYTADLLGMAVLGLVFSGTSGGRKWIRFSHREMQASIVSHQTHSDGGLKENSLRYHCLVTEMCLHFFGLLDGQVGKQFNKRLIKMCEVIAAYRDSSCGDVFAFGDDDGGRIIPFDFVADSGRVACLLGYAEILLNQRFEIPDQADHPRSGWAVSRLDGVELAAEYGGVHGAHAHNDTLSFCLNYKGAPIFTDPGSGIYTANLSVRDQLRGMGHHSVVEIDGHPQGQGGSGMLGAFSMIGPKDSCCALVNHDRVTLINQAPAQGIKAKHERAIYLEDDQTIQVFDAVSGAESKITWRFVLHSSARAEVVENGFQIMTGNNTKIQRLHDSKLDCRISAGLFSPFYGKLETAQILEAESRVEGRNQVAVHWEIQIIDGSRG